uniref:Disease resistance protein At3g14460 family n=1 Tax=Cajanus cajan TaxID=3821 RepID=A0A151RTV9_CAJCA|nr:Putative disease resistance protein At3g14460 family [Cajanus cajan]
MVSNCGKLKSVQLQINTLHSLQILIIKGLPNLESFAKEGLPIKLRYLAVYRLGGSFLTTIIREWGLQRLTCLSTLYIEGDVLNVLMKMKMPLLPTSLVQLYIDNLCDIKSLDGKWLQHLTSLKELVITDAQQLESLPEEGLPSSLSKFSIWRCPLLEASCVKRVA